MTATEEISAAAHVNAPFTDTFDSAAYEIAQTALSVRKAIGLLTEEEVAAILQLRATSTLATWRSQKSGPHYVKLGKTVFYTQNSLSRWVEEVFATQLEAAAQKAAA